jgi:16S rRNA pseudouridine516 synthase
MRLDAFLSHAGLGTRNEVKHLIRKGKVTVDGAVCRQSPAQVSRDQTITCHGEPVMVPPAVLHCLLHKPLGYACSRSAEEGPLVFDLLPELWRRVVEPAGRLDRATSGLLLLTTDGGLIHRLINPKKKLPKRYRIGYRGMLADNAVARCAEGLLLDDDERPTVPAELTLHERADDLNRATLVLTEGRYHQVRRMIAALGGDVMELHRDRIGQLDLPADLAPGECREASPEELAALGKAE